MGPAKNTMNNFKISTEVAENLVSNIAPFVSKTNKVALNIGVKDLGNGIACQAIIVNGGQMAEIGFNATVSSSVKLPESGVWLHFNVVAHELVSTLSALTAFQADIAVSVSTTNVVFKVGQNAIIPLSQVSDESMEPLLDKGAGRRLCNITFSKDFIPTLIRGSYIADSASDPSSLKDRAVFILKNSFCYVYSTNGISVSKSWCSVDASVDNVQAAVLYLKDKAKQLDGDSQKALMAKMAPLAKDPVGVVNLAKEEGFKENSKTMFSLTASTCQIISKLFSSVEKINCIVTENNICLLSGNVLATFSLAGTCASIYESIVDGWESSQWNAKVVVDKDALLRSLNLLKLGDKDSIETKLSFDNAGFAGSKNDAVVHTAALSVEGDMDALELYIDVNLLMTAVSKLHSGNVILRFVTGDNRMPVSISSGDLSEKVSNYIYLMTIKRKPQDTSSDEAENSASADK